MEFKIRDKVKIIQDGCWCREGQIGIIISHNSDSFGLHWVRFKNESYPFHEYELEIIRVPGQQLEFKFMDE